MGGVVPPIHKNMARTKNQSGETPQENDPSAMQMDLKGQEQTPASASTSAAPTEPQKKASAKAQKTRPKAMTRQIDRSLISPFKPGEKRGRKATVSEGSAPKQPKFGAESTSEWEDAAGDGHKEDAMNIMEGPPGLASMYNTFERSSDAVPPNLSTHVADALTPELAKPDPPSSVAGINPPPSTPSKRTKRTAKRKSIKAEKKQKKTLTAAVAHASLTGSTTTSATSSRKSSVAPTTRHKDFQEVTEFARQMANGCFLIATRCHKNKKELDPTSVIRAWSKMAIEETTKPMPALKSAAFYGKDVALEFSSVEDAMRADGTRLPNGGDHRIICRTNRMATAKIYVV